jgi:hypothetical protein
MRKLTLTLNVAVLFAGAVCAQIPDTPAGRQFSTWLNAFNSGERATMQQFPHALFKLSAPNIGRNRYVATRDGQRFLVIIPEKPGPPPPIMMVVNWPALLPKK